MARWTLQFLQHIITATTLLVIVNTSKLGHLTMSWSYTRPGRDIIYRTVRGKLIRCGYKYRWNTPNTVDQIEEGDTWTHTFYLTGLISESRLWYYLHEPQPPSEWECQGGLQMVDLLHAGPSGSYLYFASRSKGIFMTTTFSGPDGPDPLWVPDNEGLLSLSIRQAVLDPFIPQHRRYLIAGAHLYRHHNDVDHGPGNSITILTWPEAIALTGSPDGTIVWVEPNRRHPGMLHVLWNSAVGCNGSWHLRTLDYGEHWTAHQINAELWNRDVGNIMAGFNKGTSPYGEGDVLYAAINLDIYDKPHLARSIDQGATWTTLETPQPARGAFRPRLWTDPSNQAVLYLGSHPSYQELYRSEDHGDSWDRVEGERSKTISLEPIPSYATLRSHQANPSLVRLADRFWIHTSHDYCESWQLTETTPITLYTFKFTNDNPNLLYLATVRSGTAPPPAWKPHVIFVTTDEGATLYPKAGANAHLDDGGGDSIPYNCGGAADDGILIVS